jgi:drug/metabolite transporter (DMT)-like permease
LKNSSLRVLHQRLKTRPAGIGASVIAAIFWGFGGIFAVLVSSPGLVLTFYRLWLGAALFAILVYSSGNKMTWATLRASWLGGVFLAGDSAMFFCAVKLTSIVDATVIGAFQPVLVLLAAHRMFGERMGRWDYFWILLSIGGVTAAVVGTGAPGHHQLLGDLLATGALLCWSAYWLVAKRAREQHDAMQYTASVTLVAAITMTPVVLLSGESLGQIHTGDWLWISLIAFVPGLAHLLMNWAHRYVEASVSSVIGCLNPLVAAVAAIFILDQFLNLAQIGGVCVGLAGIAAVIARHREPANPQLPWRVD